MSNLRLNDSHKAKISLKANDRSGNSCHIIIKYKRRLSVKTYISYKVRGNAIELMPMINLVCSWFGMNVYSSVDVRYPILGILIILMIYFIQKILKR